MKKEDVSKIAIKAGFSFIDDQCGGLWLYVNPYRPEPEFPALEQGRYGHYARKPTLLYAVGTELPELRWGQSEPVFPQWAIEKYGLAKCKRAGELAFKGGGTNSTPRIHTPPEFRDLLLAIARSARRTE